MDVPFLSSGALSRAHYALVRKVESATSSSQVDQIVLAEIETIRSRFARSVHTTVRLYHLPRFDRLPPYAETDERISCHFAILFHDPGEHRRREPRLRTYTCSKLGRSRGYSAEQANRYFTYANGHYYVIFILCNTGYLYCAEMMPKGHELQLMLVNTLRKVFASFAVGTEIALSRHLRISRAPMFRTYVSALKLSFAHLLRMPYLQCKIVCMTC